MATSIRDLLQAAQDELAAHATHSGVPAAVEDAEATITVAGQILGHLQVDGIGRDPDPFRDRAITHLIQATAALPPHDVRDHRAAMLLGAAGDAIALAGPVLGRADRWALTLAIADTARRATSTHLDAGPLLADDAIAEVRRTAITIARFGAQLPPHPRALTVQDRPVPGIAGHDRHNPLHHALAAAQQLRLTVHAATRLEQPRLAVLEITAVTRSAEAATRYLTALQAALGLPPDDLSTGAPDAWAHARRSISVFTDGHTPDTANRTSTVHHAARLHDALRARFGPPDHITRTTARSLTAADADALRGIANQLPQIAQSLLAHTRRLHGRLIAPAHQLPPLPNRLAAGVNRQTVVTGGTDYTAYTHALRAAQTLSTQLTQALATNTALGTALTEPHLTRHYLTLQPSARATTNAEHVVNAARNAAARSPAARRAGPDSPAR